MLIWVMLLTMAGRCNASGMIFLTENIPYTPKMLADELDFEESTVQLALNVFEQLNMVVMDNGFFAISGWEEYQNIEGMEKIREQTRLRNIEYRKRKKEQILLHDVSVTSHDATDKEEEKELEREINNTCQQVVDLYHEICKSFPSIRSLSDARKKTIKARLKTYSLDDFRQVFENAEGSSFLKGEDGGWKASFDWMIKEANMLKVLEGNYAGKSKVQKEKVPGWGERTIGDSEAEALKQMMYKGEK